jgi:hypothetical protein
MQAAYATADGELDPPALGESSDPADEGLPLHAAANSARTAAATMLAVVRAAGRRAGRARPTTRVLSLIRLTSGGNARNGVNRCRARSGLAPPVGVVDGASAGTAAGRHPLACRNHAAAARPVGAHEIRRTEPDRSMCFIASSGWIGHSLGT